MVPFWHQSCTSDLQRICISIHSSPTQKSHNRICMSHVRAKSETGLVIESIKRLQNSILSQAACPLNINPAEIQYKECQNFVLSWIHVRLFAKCHHHECMWACEAPCISKNMDNPGNPCRTHSPGCKSLWWVWSQRPWSSTRQARIWCFSTPQIDWNHPFHRGLLGRAFYKFHRLTRIGWFL